jgi:Fe-S cluster assembly protein SufB
MAVKAQDLTKDYKYGFSDPEQYAFKSRRGLDREVVEQISAYKSEPDWMRQLRLRALDIFTRKPMPSWPAANLAEIDFQNIFYYVRPSENGAEKSWEDVPSYIKDTFDKLGFPEAESKFLACV